MDRLILWDIDGTLVRGSAAVVEAFDEALRATYSLQGAITRISYGGKTDQQIVLETLVHHEVREPEALAGLGSFCERYTSELERRGARLQQELLVLPGVPAALARLRKLGAYQTLLTGNLELTARLKLSSVGLDSFFDFAAGAFGSDHGDRNCLVPIAIAKARRHYLRDFAPQEVVVVGDTPRDIDCARAGGARVVAVATGTVAVEVLAAHQPDALLADLQDLDALLAALG